MGEVRLVRFVDTVEGDAEVHFGILFENGDILCLCCGGTVEKGDYEIREEFDSDCWSVVDNTLAEEFAE